MASNQDTHEIATNTSNLHLISRVRVQLDSSLQGHLKYTTGIERANHHTVLLQAAIDTKRPPRGLIPKGTPKIPDSPVTFTIEWEDSLQKAGMILTEKLRDYWKERARRLGTEYSPILTNLKTLTNQDQWSTVEYILEQIARETQQELKRKKPKQQAASTNNNTTNQAKRNIRITGTRSPNIPIANLSNYQLSKDRVTLLTKGLNFIPTLRKDHPAKLLLDILLFDRKIRLKYHFHHNSDHSNSDTSQEHNPIEQPTNTLLHGSSSWTLPNGQDPFLDTYRNSIMNEFLKDLDHPKLSRKKSNKEYQAMRYLQNNPNITIKPADKGGSIVIMNKVDYMKEAQRQLWN